MMQEYSLCIIDHGVITDGKPLMINAKFNVENADSLFYMLRELLVQEDMLNCVKNNLKQIPFTVSCGQIEISVLKNE